MPALRLIDFLQSKNYTPSVVLLLVNINEYNLYVLQNNCEVKKPDLPMSELIPH